MSNDQSEKGTFRVTDVIVDTDVICGQCEKLMSENEDETDQLETKATIYECPDCGGMVWLKSAMGPYGEDSA